MKNVIYNKYLSYIDSEHFNNLTNTLIQCVIDMEEYDTDLAMEMWRNILSKKIDTLCYKNVVEDVVCRVFSSINKKYNKYNNVDYICEVMMQHVVPFLEKNDYLVEIIYGNTLNAGYIGYNQNFTPICLACIIIDDKPDLVYRIMGLLYKNKMMSSPNCSYFEEAAEKEYNIGKFLTATYEYVWWMLLSDTKKEFFSKYRISERMKECLVESIKLITKKKERAECTIPILAIANFGCRG